MNARNILACLLLSLVSLAAEAGPSVLPEPGVLGLLAIGAVVGVVVAIRNRRK